MDVSGGKRSLPESAYRPLKEGEVYTPYIAAEMKIPEVTARSVFLGIIMAAIFTVAAAVAGLRAGIVFEAAIPIAILAVGIGKIYRRKNTILENVIIQSVGAASGLVVAGAVFTLPVLFMIMPERVTLLHIFLSSLLGGILGVLFLIPLRRYFVKEMHGQLPFPEATATNEILVTGEKAGKQASVLVIALFVGGIYDFVADAMRFWGTHFNWRALGQGFRDFTDNTKMLFMMETTVLFIGLGYIIGLPYVTVIVMGSFTSWLVLVPLFGYIVNMFPEAAIQVGSQLIPVAQLTPEIIFGQFVRYIGIGAIAAAGILGVIKNFGVIAGSFGVGFKGLFGRKTGDLQEGPRTDRDMNMAVVLGVILVVLVATAVFFYFLVEGNWFYMTLGLVIVMVISFLFTAVAANAIAIVGINPVSGMTLMTLVISSLVLVAAGLSGADGMLIALIMGGVVCTALSMAGGFVTDLKIGYWLGSTPIQQQRSKLIGTLIAAATVGLAILLIHHAFGFTIEDPQTGLPVPNPQMPAPQANAMKAVIELLMSPEAQVPLMLFGIGILLILFVDRLKVPALAFGLGMYLPQEINTSLLLGAFAAWLLSKSSKNEALVRARTQKGTLIASGFIAGAALFKILEAVLRIVPLGEGNVLEQMHASIGVNEVGGTYLFGVPDVATILGLVFIVLLTGWLFWNSWRARPEDEPAEESQETVNP